ncbi:nucleotidyltransferase (plasmid) [Rhodococcus ruber]|uniref:nucleotidyltransferase domain-containing protein n=1 Tax=Rhodococcus ruber TaxID=1830 RepID=UPI00200C2579|nr:nucleotidyltransferase [Rhodococcus ruber]UQB75915.1 nucleotidyltransferase [Rhodococcus ruber]
MPQLTAQFRQALSNIEPTDEDKANAPEAHQEVREVLVADGTLSGWGLNPVLIGSYKRHVSIRRMKDVDLFGRLEDLPRQVEPAELLKEFERVLKAEFGGDRVARQARSLQVAFPDLDGLYVDAVPARPWTSPHGEKAWQLPKRGEDGWQATNPERLTELTSELNNEFNKLYVPVVKLLRQTRRSLMGQKKPGGLTIEIAAMLAFQSGDVTGTTVGDLYVSALRKTGDLLYNAFVLSHGLEDPTLTGERLHVRGEDADKQALATAFIDAGARAQDALDADADDKCTAAKAFRDILGKAVDDQGSQDYVFPMPDDCNLNGTRKDFTRVRAGDAQVAGGDRRFG